MNNLALALACVLATALPAAAENADITGSWTVIVTLADGPRPPATLTLKTDGAKIVGTFSGQRGDMPVEASVKEKVVTIWFTVPTQDGPISVTMNGTADGDTMKGSADLGSHGQAEWSARRPGTSASPVAPATELDVTGTWTFDVQTAAGSGTPTIALKQDGETLTGRTGQLGEAPLTGIVKGTAVEFAFDLSVQGTPIHVVYAGTADTTSMKGTVAFGELGDGTFTAKKK